MCQFHWEMDCVGFFSGFSLLKFGDVVVLKR